MEIACSLNYHCILRNRQMVRGTPKETHGWRGGGVTWFITYRSIPPGRRMWRREYSSSSWTGWGTRWLGTGLLSSPSASDRWRALSPEKGQTTHAYYILCTCYLMKRVESILAGRTCTCSDARSKQRREWGLPSHILICFLIIFFCLLIFFWSPPGIFNDFFYTIIHSTTNREVKIKSSFDLSRKTALI